ncbi:Cell-division initiation protein (septum placement) [Carnobacterium sp. AT7]|uniref:DivIVA domain-containing protein n=2 Tax=Carnobacteriaceae TaxID=186828 RepID=UPI00015F1A6C|nr:MULTISPECIES: DivIVA domain-containing protein [Carnobacterium]EDP68207.1 Cell-division initiation protein (septum placement) [Carnobacterium sp. AT7]
MVLTPLDIHNKEFPVKMRGYDQDQVNDYLDQIIKDYEIVLKEKRELEKQLQFSEEKVGHFNNLQDALNKSIIVAQDAADRLRENAAKEANIIGLEAEKHADRLLDEAVAKAKKITTETDELKKQSRVFKQRLQIMIESQLEMVKNSEWDDLLRPAEEEVLNIPTLKEILSVSQSKDNAVNADVEASNHTIEEDDAEVVEKTTEVSNANSEHNHEEEQDSIEGTLPAIELPK